jgi:hypothetical protein
MFKLRTHGGGEMIVSLGRRLPGFMVSIIAFQAELLAPFLQRVERSLYQGLVAGGRGRYGSGVDPDVQQR